MGSTLSCVRSCFFYFSTLIIFTPFVFSTAFAQGTCAFVADASHPGYVPQLQGKNRPAHDFVILFDASGSMYQKQAAAKHAARTFIEGLDFRTDRVAFVQFSQLPIVRSNFTNNKAHLHNVINGVEFLTYTNTEWGLDQAKRLLDANGRAAQKTILVITDGASPYLGKLDWFYTRSDYPYRGIAYNLRDALSGRSVRLQDYGMLLFSTGNQRHEQQRDVWGTAHVTKANQIKAAGVQIQVIDIDSISQDATKLRQVASSATNYYRISSSAHAQNAANQLVGRLCGVNNILAAPPTPVPTPRPRDTDYDGVLDTVDNCRTIRNSLQTDTDRDGIGDACDQDIDGDGVLNNVDNCMINSNTDQRDSDRNGHGDVCDYKPNNPQTIASNYSSSTISACSVDGSNNRSSVREKSRFCAC